MSLYVRIILCHTGGEELKARRAAKLRVQLNKNSVCRNFRIGIQLVFSYIFRITAEGHKGPRPRRISEPSADEEDLALLTPEERERRKSFEQKRKAHYNEFYAVKMARQLMQDEPEEDDEDSKSAGDQDLEQASCSNSSMTKASSSNSDKDNTGANSPMDTSSHV